MAKVNLEGLILADLIDIQNIVYNYSKIRWFLPDIIKGSKIVGGVTYILLDELKKEHEPVLNSIYIDGEDIVSIDIGLVDKKYKRNQPIWSRMYKYYNKNWYQILKSYKKLMLKGTIFEDEYQTIMKTMEIDNAILAQSNLIESLINFNVFGQNLSKISGIFQKFKTNLNNIGITTINLKNVQKILVNKLNNKAKPYVDYFLDKLTNTGKIKTYLRLRLLNISQFTISKQILIERNTQGFQCPFFKKSFEELIDIFATKLMMTTDMVKKCFIKVFQKENPNLSIDIYIKDFINKFFKLSPINRLFLSIKNNKLYIRGALDNNDHYYLKNLGEKKQEYYVIDTKYTKKLQTYLLTGK